MVCLFSIRRPIASQRSQSASAWWWLVFACVAIHSIIPSHGLVSPCCLPRGIQTASSAHVEDQQQNKKPSLLSASSTSTTTTSIAVDVAIKNNIEVEHSENSLVEYFGTVGAADVDDDDDSSSVLMMMTSSNNNNNRRAFLIAGGAVLTAVGLLDSADRQKAHAATTTTTIVTTGTTGAAAVIDWPFILEKAGKRALGGGKAGASAAVVQVCALMWLRTSMNYQYRYGGNLSTSLQTLWQEGGLPRLYQGLPFALVQGPLTRFGDTAANVGVLAALEALEVSRDWPLPLKTLIGSCAAGLWRIVLMPIDASKTALQVEGKDGLTKLWSNASPSKLYQGALAQAAATAVGHFPWFLTYNALDAQIPAVSSADNLLLSLSRSAVLGLSASCVSDCSSNSLRVIKTTKQTAQLGNDDNAKELSYPEVVRLIVATDGVKGLFGRGLQTRLLTNAIQGAVFSILWKFFETNQSVGVV
jgi:Mitochondrial carrier protein